jgi:pimeloyl-ACP methyl ester carboxylesterase
MELKSTTYHLDGDDYRVAYWQSGSPLAKKVLFCVHGLLGRSRDFDELIEALRGDFLCLAIDLPGRGQSDWLKQPEQYSPDNYLPPIIAVLNALDNRPVHWVGTSLGGILAMAAASLKIANIEKLVLNDVGCHIPKASLQRIAAYVKDPLFTDQQALIDHIKRTYPSFRDLTEVQWQRVAQYGSRQADDGLHLHYDPAIAVNVRLGSNEDIDLMPLWQGIECPQMLIHGTASDLLRQEIVDVMLEHKPDLELLQLQGLGHAPPLMTPFEVQAITEFLKRSDA